MQADEAAAAAIHAAEHTVPEQHAADAGAE